MTLYLCRIALIAACFLSAPGHAVDEAVRPVALEPGQARSDIELSIQAVEAALPDIHWHQSPEEWGAAKQRALTESDGIDDPMGVYVTVSQLMAHIGEGHLNVFPPKSVRDWQRQTALLLPLDLHWNTDGVFVIAGYGEAADIPVGSRILSINGQDAQALLDELLSMEPRDGRIQTGAMRECAAECYAVQRQRIRGNETSFLVQYQTPDGIARQATLTPHPMRDRPATPPRKRRVASLDWLAPGLAYLDVPSFSNRIYRENGTTFRSTMQRLFEDLQRGRAGKLILDLRQNGGGSEPNESILFSYLVETPLRKYAAVETRGQRISVTTASGQVFEQEVFDEDEINFQRELPDGRLTRLNVPPEGLMSHWEPSDPVFRGQLVILVSGRTFSGGAELASMLYHAHRGVFVGEEVGGAHEGNTSGYGWELTLPNSGVKLDIPMLQFRFAWPGLPSSRGVQPACDVPPLAKELGKRRDRAWHVAREIALQSWTQPDDASCPALRNQ